MAASFSIDKNIVKALALFADKGNYRPVLEGINFREENGNITAAASDSYMLMVAQTLIPASPDFGEFTIPAAELASIKTARGCDYVIELQDDGFTCKVTGDMGKTWHEIKLTAQSYPNYRKLLPIEAERFEPQAGFFNPAYIERIGKAFRTVGAQCVAVATRELKAGIFTAKRKDVGTFSVLIMPVKSDDKDTLAPYAKQGKADDAEVKALKEKIKALEIDLSVAQRTIDALDGDMQRIRNERDRYSQQLQEAKDAQHEQPHEWESKTLRWFDHEVEGARQCQKEGSKNYGMWFIPKAQVATA